MAAVPLCRGTDVAAVTSRENTLYRRSNTQRLVFVCGLFFRVELSYRFRLL